MLGPNGKVSSARPCSKHLVFLSVRMYATEIGHFSEACPLLYGLFNANLCYVKRILLVLNSYLYHSV